MHLQPLMHDAESFNDTLRENHDHDAMLLPTLNVGSYCTKLAQLERSPKSLN